MRRLGLCGLVLLPVAAAFWLWRENHELRAEAAARPPGTEPERPSSTMPRARTQDEVARAVSQLLPAGDSQGAAPRADWQR